MNSTTAAIRNIGESPEPPWLADALTALDALEGVRYGRRKDRFGGVLFKAVRACVEAYVRRFASAGIAPVLTLTVPDLHRWRVELGLPALDREAASRVLHAWHDVVASLHATPGTLTAEDSTGRWITVRLCDQHHDHSHEHRYWVEVSINDGAGVHQVLEREKGKTVGLGEILASALKPERATSWREVEPPQGDALTEVRGFLLSFFRDLGVKQVSAAYAALQQGRREGWSRKRIFLAMAVALATACGVWYWRVVHYTYSTALASRAGPLVDWGPPDAIQPVFWLGERVGHIEYNRPAPDIVRLRYFREKTAWCPKHHMPKDLLEWQLVRNGEVFYTQATNSTPWCEIRRADLPQDPFEIRLSMSDGAEVKFRTLRGGVVDITTLQPEGEEPRVVVTATESPSSAPVMTGAQSVTTEAIRQP